MRLEKVVTAVAQLLIAILLILLAIFLYSGFSTGWFSKNEKVEGSGIRASVQGFHLGEISGLTTTVTRPSLRTDPGKETYTHSIAVPAPEATQAEMSARVLFPEDQITVSAVFSTTASLKKIPVEFEISSAGPRDEVAVQKGGSFWYLSRNIRVTGVQLFEMKNGKRGKEVPVTGFTPGYLSPGGPAVFTELRDPYTLACGSAELPGSVGGDTFELVLSLVFENTAGDQSLLRGDWETADPVPSSFLRTLVLTEIS